MGNDDLSQSLLGLAAWFSRTRAGDYQWSPEGMEAFEAALDKAAVRAIVLEHKVDAAYGRRPTTVEVLQAVQAGKVVVLPTGRAISAIFGPVTEVPFG